ncbi:CotH kinase family protein [Lachnospiraceae bacterium C1.1]|nr:CotH kinase family protein [Lachnospiraceae bacterium C1.1]
MDNLRRALRRNTVKISLAAVFIFLLFLIIGIRLNEPAESIKINEVCSSNLASLHDDKGEHPDWIELYNSSDEEMDLSGWFLSDSEHHLDKWTFPEGTSISANGFLLVYADNTPEAEPDTDESLSLTNFIMTGRAIATESNGLHTNFSLSASGENLYLSDNKKFLLDSVEVPELRYDTVWAREEDGKGTFSRRTPTPGETNALSEALVLPSLSKPVFSAESGFYDEDFKLEISADEGETIRYTLDGSIPNENSYIYTDPIEITDVSKKENIYSSLWQVSVELLSYVNFRYKIPERPVDKCNIIRAAAFGENGEISDVSTAVYFVGFDKKKTYDGIGVISVISDPDGIFGYENGNFVMGKIGVESFREKLSESENAVKYLEEHPETPTDGTVSVCGIKMHEYLNYNYIQKGTEWEREAQVTAFDEDHDLEFDGLCGLRVKGHRTRNFAKKSFNLYARDIYGVKNFNGLGDIDEGYSRTVLFSGGNDMYTFVKDELATELAQGLDFATPEYTKPYYLFIDGEFWGIYRVGDKLGSEWLSDLYGPDKDNIAVVKNSLLADGGEAGDKVWGELQNFVWHADFTVDSDYEKINNMLDMDSLIDYFAFRIFIDEGMDWPNTNTALWRMIEDDDKNEETDTRWRWINFDNNANFDYSAVSTNTLNKARYGTRSYSRDELFAKLMENEDFRERFYKRFLEISDENFDPDKTIPKLDALAEEVRPYVENEYGRFFADDMTVEDFDELIERMRMFLRERAEYIKECVKEECGG